MGSLTHEVSELPNPVGVHTLSPGMVLTDLLLDGATHQNKQIFNILCEQVRASNHTEVSLLGFLFFCQPDIEGSFCTQWYSSKSSEASVSLLFYVLG